ncbi:MAG: EcsC family protein [Deltaproteobacteria bacterium]|nr:EcsC family protein [Deltaproteobacteria bacterium]
MRVANLLGRPADTLLDRLPGRARKVVAQASEAALRKALDWAIASLGDEGATPGVHSASAGALGGLGGFFGLAALPLELPATTVVMLRSIAAIARAEGADLSDPEVRLECLSVLAMGGQMPSPIDTTFEGEPSPLADMESSYWTARLGMAIALRSAARQLGGLTGRQLASELAAGASPMLARLIGMVAARFQVVVGEKAIAQAVPVLGAAAGAALNVAFAEHFSSVARHHFGLRRLERQRGSAAVQAAYARALERHRQKKLQTP